MNKMKIVNRRIQVGIEVDIATKDGKQYTMAKRYVFFYLISLILFINAGILSVVLMRLPMLFNIDVKWITLTLVIVNLSPILIFGLIPKRIKYIEIEME